MGGAAGGAATEITDVKNECVVDAFISDKRGTSWPAAGAACSAACNSETVRIEQGISPGYEDKTFCNCRDAYCTEADAKLACEKKIVASASQTFAVTAYQRTNQIGAVGWGCEINCVTGCFSEAAP